MEPVEIIPVVKNELAIEDLIIDYAQRYGVNSNLALKIASCESGFNQFNKDGSVFRGRQNPQDIGIFQINEYYHLKSSQNLGLNIYQKEGNIEFAMTLLSNVGSSPWNWSRGCWG